MVFKCKMCGGVLPSANNVKIVTCEYCGTRQTVPCPDSERIAELFEKADTYRHNLDFDKALALYEEILNENLKDVEGWWLSLLCEYGIEYVEEGTGGKRIPTINRMQLTPIFEHARYKSALKYADEEQTSIYKAEADEINTIQKGILDISEKEEPFDIFICYKESDDSGRRTMDSVLATDLYEFLTEEGYKVFFSRVTLDDKFGVAYEPYIFAALQSSKIMIAVGTKPEYYNAIWVRNEWSRYISFIKSGAKKVLIPAYKEMNPYELPEEFVHLQAVNMDKLGYREDLLRSIRKIIDKKPISAFRPEKDENAEVDRLLVLFYFNIEEKDWEAALRAAEDVLKIQSHNQEAKLGALLAAMHIFTVDDMKAWDVSAKKDFLAIMQAYNVEYMQDLYERLRKKLPQNVEKVYSEAVKKIPKASTIEEMDLLIQELTKCKNYKKAVEYLGKCKIKKEEIKKQQYLENCDLAESSEEEDVSAALKYFESARGYLNADQKAQHCRERLEMLEQLKIQKKIAEKNKIIKITILSIIAIHLIYLIPLILMMLD